MYEFIKLLDFFAKVSICGALLQWLKNAFFSQARSFSFQFWCHLCVTVLTFLKKDVLIFTIDYFSDKFEIDRDFVEVGT